MGQRGAGSPPPRPRRASPQTNKHYLPRPQANLPEDRKREVQNVIQSYFREWLNSTGKMRNIYDVARLERD